MDRNTRSGSEPQVPNEVRAPRSVPSLSWPMRLRGEARVGPLRASANAAIGVDRKFDTTDLAVTVHWGDPRIQSTDDALEWSTDRSLTNPERPPISRAVANRPEVEADGTLGIHSYW